MRKCLRSWWPALLNMLFIFYVSSLPGDVVGGLGLGKESYHINGHFLMFFVLGVTLFKATKSFFWSALLGVLYGVFDEFHQVFVPGRSAGIFDVFVDSIGIFISLGVLWKLYPILLRKLKRLPKK